MATTDELYTALQQFKLYVQQTFPFKHTIFEGTADPSAGAGIAAPVGAFYSQKDGGGLLLKIWVKKTLVNTGWEDSAGGGSGSGVLLWQPNTPYTSFATSGVPALIWESASQKFYYNLADFTSSATFAADQLLNRWIELGATNPMLPIGAWNMTPAQSPSIPDVAVRGTLQVDSPTDYVLLPPATTTPNVDPSYTTDTTPITVDGTVQWSKLVANTSSEITFVGTLIFNDGATDADLVASLFGAITGTCTFASLVFWNPAQPGAVSIILRSSATPQSIFTFVNLAQPAVNGDAIYVGVNTANGDILVQRAGDAPINITTATTGFVEVATPQNFLVAAAAVYTVANPTAAANVHFHLSTSDLGKTGFHSSVPAALPGDAADGKRYVVTGPGPYLTYNTQLLDVVEFRNSMQDLVITRTVDTSIIPWDIVASQTQEPATPTSLVSAGVTGTAPGPYVLTPSGNLSALAQALAISDNGIAAPYAGGTTVSASLSWPDLTGGSGSFTGVGFALVNSAATYDDFVSFINLGSSAVPLYGLYINFDGSNIFYGLIDNSTNAGTGSVGITPLVTGEKLFFDYNQATGAVYAGSTVSGPEYLSTLPVMPSGQTFKIMAYVGFHPGLSGQPADATINMPFIFHETEGSRTGMTLPVAHLPVTATASRVVQATTGGIYLGKTLAYQDLAIVLTDNLNINVLPFASVEGAVMEGDSVLLLTNPAGNTGYVTRQEQTAAIDAHKIDTLAHPVATTLAPGFMSAADKISMSKLAPAATEHEWRPAFETRAAIGTGSWGSLAFSPKLNRIVARRNISSTTANTMYSDDGGVNWTQLGLFGTFSSSRGNVYWVPDIDKFILFNGQPTFNTWLSDNGVDGWGTAVAGPGVDTVYSLAWSPELGIAVVGSSGTTPRLYYSSDLSTWTQSTPPYSTVTQGFRQVAWSPKLKMFVAIPYISSDPSVYSTDGINWVASPNPMISNYWTGLTWVPELEMFIAVAQTSFFTPAIVYSRDGLLWQSAVSTNITTSLEAVAWSPELGVLLATGDNGTNWSADGLSWNNYDSSNNFIDGLRGKAVIWCSAFQTFVSGYGTEIRRMTNKAPLLGRTYDNSQPVAKVIPLGLTRTFTIGDKFSRHFKMTTNSTVTIPTHAVADIEVGTVITIDKLPNNVITWSTAGVTITELGNPPYASQVTLIKTAPNAWTIIYTPRSEDKVITLNSSGGSLFVDLSAATTFLVPLTENILEIQFSNLPGSGYRVTPDIRFVQDATPWTVTWPGTFKWEGAPPSVSTGAGAIDLLQLKSVDNGGSWYPVLRKNLV